MRFHTPDVGPETFLSTSNVLPEKSAIAPGATADSPRVKMFLDSLKIE